ncbi:MAG: hypothetical protein KIT77_10605 [Caldilinea sp.]|nr:hypothetical protein [Caldilinea sp.]
MLRERIDSLFQQHDPALRQLILTVLEIEQEFISMERPRGIFERIDEIVTKVSEMELQRNGEGGE